MFTPLSGPKHAAVHSRMMKELIVEIDSTGLCERFGVFGNGHLKTGRHDLRWPDLIVGRLPLDLTGLLTGAGVALVVEIAAGSTLPDDLDEKRSKYACAGIQEYWVVDMEQGLLYDFRHPEAGDYADCTPLRAGDEIAPLFAPQIVLNVSELV